MSGDLQQHWTYERTPITCTVCGAEDVSDNHMAMYARIFDDGCGFANYRCADRPAWVWPLDSYEATNPHGHDLMDWIAEMAALDA